MSDQEMKLEDWWIIENHPHAFPSYTSYQKKHRKTINWERSALMYIDIISCQSESWWYRDLVGCKAMAIGYFVTPRSTGVKTLQSIYLYRPIGRVYYQEGRSLDLKDICLR